MDSSPPSRRPLHISTARTQGTAWYTPNQLTWSEIVRWLKSRPEAKSKDNGNFVGGVFEGNYRLRVNLKKRDLLTLDADKAVPEALPALVWLELDCAMVAYTTYSHGAKGSRWRVVAPLSRSVNEMEYWRITQAVMAAVEPECWDTTHAQAERLMHNPPGLPGSQVLEFEGGPLDVKYWLKRADALGLGERPPPKTSDAAADETVVQWLAGLPDGECPVVLEARARLLKIGPPSSGTNDLVMHAQQWTVYLGVAGHPGVREALEAGEKAWLEAERDGGDWNRLLAGALGTALGDPMEDDRACCVTAEEEFEPLDEDGEPECMMCLLVGECDEHKVELAALLSAVEAFVRRYVIFPVEEGYPVVALWVAHTYVYGAFDSSPRLAVLSPDPGSGKTRVLELLELLCRNPLHAMSATPAALFRSIPERPSILFDEVDAIFGPKAGEHEDLRALLNAGHRKGAMALRCEAGGKEIEVKKWPVYAPVALAGLGWLPDTLMSRSIILNMKKRRREEQVEPFRRRKGLAESKPLRDGLRAWAKSGDPESLRDAWAEMPGEVTDRDADVWEAMLLIADLAGHEWPVVARKAAVEFVTRRKNSSSGSLGALLLKDLRTLFIEIGQKRVASRVLVDGLLEMEESPWGKVVKGQPLDVNELARRLAPYDVRPTTVKTKEDEKDVTAKGYKIEDFEDAWSRYLPSDFE